MTTDGVQVPALPLPRLAAAASLAALAVILAAIALWAPLPPVAAAWGGAALGAWCAALLVACSTLAGRDGLGLAQWKLGSWFLALTALADGLASITWAHPQTGVAALILPPSVTRAEWVTAAGVTAWGTAYCTRPWRGPERLMRRLTARRSAAVRSPLTPWLLYAAGSAARLAGAVLTGHFGYAGNAVASVTSASPYQQVLTLATYACALAITVAGLRAFREKAAAARLAVAGLLAAEIATALVMGQKGEIGTAVIAVAVASASAGLRMPRKLILAAAAFFLLIVIPFTAAYRADIRSGPADLSPAAAARAAPAIATTAAGAASPATLGASVSYLVQRSDEIDSAAVTVQKTPTQIPYSSPARIPQTLASDLIPRVLWPGKPILDSGYEFSQQYYGTPPGEVTAAAVTREADLWGYGGWVPLLTGMAFIGWLTRAVDESTDLRTCPQAALLVVLLFPVLTESSFTSILLALPFTALTWLVITFTAFRRQPAFTLRS
jgi:hypothetical protein